MYFFIKHFFHCLRLDGNYTRMLRAVLNKSWRQHPTRLQLYGHLPPITKTIQVRRTRHAGHCWRSKDELISDVLLWTPTHGCARVGWPARTYIQQLCEDTGCNPEDLPEAMNDREKWRETVRDIRAGGVTWWWWWLLHYAEEDLCLKDKISTKFPIVYFSSNPYHSKMAEGLGYLCRIHVYGRGLLKQLFTVLWKFSSVLWAYMSITLHHCVYIEF